MYHICLLSFEYEILDQHFIETALLRVRLLMISKVHVYAGFISCGSSCDILRIVTLFMKV